MINHLTYCRILRIDCQEISAERRTGNVRTVTTGNVVLARIRDLHAESKFFYKGHEVKRFGAWVGLESAVEEAQRVSLKFALGPDSEGEFRVDLQITERSVTLVRPERYDSCPRYDDNPDTQRVIDVLPGHGESTVLNEVVWSSKRSATQNTGAVELALAVFENDGRLPRSCLEEIVAQFKC